MGKADWVNPPKPWNLSGLHADAPGKHLKRVFTPDPMPPPPSPEARPDKMDQEYAANDTRARLRRGSRKTVLSMGNVNAART